MAHIERIHVKWSHKTVQPQTKHVNLLKMIHPSVQITYVCITPLLVCVCVRAHGLRTCMRARSCAYLSGCRWDNNYLICFST